MTVGEINVIVSFVCMVLLFTGPSVLSLALGVDHPVASYLRNAVPTWLVPPARPIKVVNPRRLWRRKESF